ncbi:MAG TPA: ComF family protein [Candidatus Acetothermia bacterium]|nr:ComF family protein [Candidatus Acetothermia bacterium]
MTTSGDTQTSSYAWLRFSKTTLLKAGEGPLAVLFPPRCLLCGKPTPQLDILCERCIADLPPLEGPRCVKCQEPLSDPSLDLCRACGTRERWFDRALSLGPYEGAWGKLVRSLKFDKEPAVARFLSSGMAEYLVKEKPFGNIDVITYVPMTRRALHARGFNQAKLLARGLAKRIHRPMTRLLAKKSETQPQARLSARARRENLRGAFHLIRSVSGKVLLVDDIFTTGSTVEECAHTLKRGGCEEVFVLTVARA